MIGGEKTWLEIQKDMRDARVAAGTLVIRQMTPEERELWGPARPVEPKGRAKTVKKTPKASTGPQNAAGKA